MSSPFTIRLDKEIRQRVGQIAKRKRSTTSEVVREAIVAWIDQESKLTPYDTLKDLIGTVHGGKPKRTAGGGRQVTKLLKDRRSRS